MKSVFGGGASNGKKSDGVSTCVSPPQKSNGCHEKKNAEGNGADAAANEEKCG